MRVEVLQPFTCSQEGGSIDLKAGQITHITGEGLLGTLEDAGYIRRLDPGDMVGVVITLNGVQWQVRSFAPHPGSFGADLGQVYLMLEEPAA